MGRKKRAESKTVRELVFLAFLEKTSTIIKKEKEKEHKRPWGTKDSEIQRCRTPISCENSFHFHKRNLMNFFSATFEVKCS